MDGILGMLITVLPLDATCLVAQACWSSYMNGALMWSHCLCVLRVHVNNTLVRTTGGVVSVIVNPFYNSSRQGAYNNSRRKTAARSSACWRIFSSFQQMVQ